MQHNRKRGKRKAKPIPAWVEEREYLELLRATPGIHHKLAMMFAWESGLRISETINLEPNDINLEDNTFIVREGKGMKDRIVPLPFSFQLDYHMQFLPIACSKRALETAFTKAAVASGLKEKKPKICFHSFRHGYARYNLMMGMDVTEIQPLMGHEDIQTTAHYAKIHPFKPIKSWRDKVSQEVAQDGN